VEVKNAMMLASTREDAEGLARKVTLLEEDLAADRQVWEASEREHRAHFEELTLLQTRGSELCHVIAGPPWEKHHLSKGMQLVTLRHTEMARKLTVYQAVVSSPWSRCSGARPVTPPVRRWWMSHSLNSKRWRGGACDMSGLSLESAT
jgi:hypothetical protein